MRRGDVALAVLAGLVELGGTALAARHQAPARTLDVYGYLLLGAGAAALVARRGQPVPVLMLAFATTLGYVLLGYPGGPIWLALVVAFGTALMAGHRRAAALFERCLAEQRGRGGEHIAARDLSALGTAMLNLGELPRARTLLEESLEVARRYDDRWSSAMSLTLLAHVRLAEGDHARARAELAEATALFAATGNMVYLPWCLEALAGVAAAGQEYGRAAEIAGARDALRARTGALLPPVHRAAYERMLDVVRADLGEAGFAAAHGKLAHLAPPDIIEAVTEDEANHE